MATTCTDTPRFVLPHHPRRYSITDGRAALGASENRRAKAYSISGIASTRISPKKTPLAAPLRDLCTIPQKKMQKKCLISMNGRSRARNPSTSKTGTGPDAKRTGVGKRLAKLHIHACGPTRHARKLNGEKAKGGDQLRRQVMRPGRYLALATMLVAAVIGGALFPKYGVPGMSKTTTLNYKSHF